MNRLLEWSLNDLVHIYFDTHIPYLIFSLQIIKKPCYRNSSLLANFISNINLQLIIAECTQQRSATYCLHQQGVTSVREMSTNCGNEADHTSPHSLHSGVSLQPISAPSSVKTESSKLSFIALGGVRIKTALYSLKSPEEGRACSAYSATKFFQQLWEPHFMTLYPHFTPSLCFLSFYCLSKEKFLLFRASQSSVHFFHN